MISWKLRTRIVPSSTQVDLTRGPGVADAKHIDIHAAYIKAANVSNEDTTRGRSGFEEVDIGFDGAGDPCCTNARSSDEQQPISGDVQRAIGWIVAIGDRPVDAGDGNQSARQADRIDADVFDSCQLNAGASVDGAIEFEFATTIQVAKACVEDDRTRRRDHAAC